MERIHLQLNLVKFTALETQYLGLCNVFACNFFFFFYLIEKVLPVFSLLMGRVCSKTGQ